MCKRRRERRADVDAGADRFNLGNSDFDFRHSENELYLLCFTVKEEQKGLPDVISGYIYMTVYSYLHHLEFSSNFLLFVPRFFFTMCTIFYSTRPVIITCLLACKLIYFEDNLHLSLSLSLSTEITAAPSLSVVKTDLALELVSYKRYVLPTRSDTIVML